MSLVESGVMAYNASTAAPEVNAEQELTDAQLNVLQHLEYWVDGIVTNLVVVLGLVGNLLTIIILSQRAMRSSTNYYLSALAVWDSVVLVCTCLLIGLPGAKVQTYTDHGHAYVVSYIYPIALIAQTATIWLTVSFTVERYIAVCHPLKAASMCTISRAKIIIAGVSLGSALYNIPRWFDFRPKVIFNPSTNETVSVIARTNFSQNPLYLKVYFSWLYVPMMVIVPLLLLSVLNTFLILAVRRSRRQRKDMNVKQSRENNITIMLVSVVIVFIICQVPALVYNLAYAIDNRYVDISFGYQVLSKIRNFLVTLNSAVNFLLYCALGQKFRRIFLHMFFRRCINETYIPMSGLHGTGCQSTTVVSMAAGKGRIICRTTLNNISMSKSSTDASNHSTSTHTTTQSRSSQESSLMGSQDYMATPTYGAAKNYSSYAPTHKDRQKFVSHLPRTRENQNESDQDDPCYDGTLDQLLTEQQKNHSQRNVYPLYKKNKNGCSANRKLPV